ncbi:MAG: radical SAM protein [Acidobacteria bacterium]|nr:radical SAM protein [Acidobacteriota bacterium]
MANISIASHCNRACSYCFAMETLDGMAAQTSFMSMETYVRTLDFLERSGIDEVRLLGGEPTLHPQFGELIDVALQRKFRILVFSGGLIRESALAKLEQISKDQLTLLLNVIPPELNRPAGAGQEETLWRLGNRVILGLNIDSPGVELDFLLEMIGRYGLAPIVRLGIAHPILGGTNRYLHPRHYPEVGRRVAAFGLQAAEAGVRINFDCGWVPCMFPEGALEALAISPDEVGLRCNPILDILPDGNVISCYPLANHSVIPLPDEHDSLRLRSEFSGKQSGDRGFMLYKECEACAWRARGECTGGCLAGSMRRLRRSEFLVSIT